MKRRFWATVVILLLLPTLKSYSSQFQADSLWQVLMTELKNEHIYLQKKENKIQKIKQQLAEVRNDSFNLRFELMSDLFTENKAYKFDSAITVIHDMIALSRQFNDKKSLVLSQMELATVLKKSGFYKEAFDAVSTIDTASMDRQIQYEFLILRAGLNREIGAYTNDAYYAKRYRENSQRDLNEAKEIFNPNVVADSLEETIQLALQADGKQRKKPSASFYYNYLLKQGLSDHQIAMIATRISQAYEKSDKLLLLTFAAIHDLRSATKETFAIFLLGQELFKLKRTNDSYICILEALNNAAFYGTRHRATQVETILPLIVNKLVEEKQFEKNVLLIGVVIFLVVIVVLFFQLVLFRKQVIKIKKNKQVIKQKNNELQLVNDKLWESSRIKEELIGLFITTCSSYIETLDRIKFKTLHSIKLGNFKDATTMLNKVNKQKEKNNLYSTLDSVFLTLFPNFINSFNTLLKPEDQIFLKEGDTLTATLRIFALMRLGITDNETIAKILDYTVNTVYTYKARIKSKAVVSPELFKQKIMEIKFTDDRRLL